eukprot:CAMPEP_0205880244 /NCGR_PEP_ID=MMETSP1083-20121108/15836_1 /ASSEMBLY_ACC=CAM_ASM_000430 /TAXON_ID=97485 /ORGANISM="Prymnesium parvum, Strain Texoma1" /LENGTH=244 /DNA_ID=CAMNT_0053243275 /DNA_START=577 /DNA_END=1308 /DNA_ORIENTATION=-
MCTVAWHLTDTPNALLPPASICSCWRGVDWVDDGRRGFDRDVPAGEQPPVEVCIEQTHELTQALLAYPLGRGERVSNQVEAAEVVVDLRARHRVAQPLGEVVEVLRPAVEEREHDGVEGQLKRRLHVVALVADVLEVAEENLRGSRRDAAGPLEVEAVLVRLALAPPLVRPLGDRGVLVVVARPLTQLLRVKLSGADAAARCAVGVCVRGSALLVHERTGARLGGAGLQADDAEVVRRRRREAR